MDYNILIDFAINCWLLNKHLSELYKDDNLPSKILIPLNSMIELTQKKGIELIDLSKTKYDSGLAVEIVSYTCDPTLIGENVIIHEMIRPIVKYNDKIIRRGQVILAPSSWNKY